MHTMGGSDADSENNTGEYNSIGYKASEIFDSLIIELLR